MWRRACLAVVLLGATATPATAETETATAAVSAGAPLVAAPEVGEDAVCVDAVIANRLAVRRQKREAVDRLFVKQQRHELSFTGGWYSSDLFSSTYVLGGAYTFHMTETTAVEFGGGYTHANADVIRAIEDRRGQALDETFDDVIFAEALLVWTPMYGKFRLGGQVVHLDVNLSAGVGVVDSQTNRGASGIAGLGAKLFGGKAFAVRLDIRDRVFRQELLDEAMIVNDLTATLGLSVFLPFRN